MKVSLCPKCNVTPQISSTELKCPKCGRKVTGKDLTDTVEKWNKGEVEPSVTTEEVAESFIEDVEAVKDELPEKPVKKPIKKAAKKGKE